MSTPDGPVANEPPHPESDDDSSTSDPLDLRGDEGWDDIEPDDETITVVSLFDDQTFPNVLDMLLYSKNHFSFNIWEVRKDLSLDFFGLIRLVNYVRSEVKKGNSRPDVSSTSLFNDERYLQPVLEDDAMLYSLDDVFDDEASLPAVSEVDQLRAQLADLQSQFSTYREEVQKALDDRFADEPPPADSTLAKEKQKAKDETYEADYFSSYSGNTIHALMLKDTVRTDAYRDFVYAHKHLFANKTVLDVGCGTGILSLFCARAGAKLVIAVDNSTIINTTRQIVYENGFQGVIKCLHGRIEDVSLPVEQVDVVVSEWMGYCLLYESMLDSVLFARDRYLVPGGLMVPSHATLRLSALAGSDLVADHVGFWDDVYGFGMKAMKEGVCDEPLVQSVDPASLTADNTSFLTLDLHTVKQSELTFVKPFHLTWRNGLERLEGFVVWFDIFFLTSPNTQLPEDITVSHAQKKDVVSFSTGPEGTQTHWMQGVFLIQDPRDTFSEGELLEGQIGYAKREGQERSLDIEIRWQTPRSKGQGQTWFLN